MGDKYNTDTYYEFGYEPTNQDGSWTVEDFDDYSDVDNEPPHQYDNEEEEEQQEEQFRQSSSPNISTGTNNTTQRFNATFNTAITSSSSFLSSISSTSKQSKQHEKISGMDFYQFRVINDLLILKKRQEFPGQSMSTKQKSLVAIADIEELSSLCK
jgi:hypothetical protein